jgi:hypothetical protein
MSGTPRPALPRAPAVCGAPSHSAGCKARRTQLPMPCHTSMRLANRPAGPGPQHAPSCLSRPACRGPAGATARPRAAPACQGWGSGWRPGARRLVPCLPDARRPPRHSPHPAAPALPHPQALSHTPTRIAPLPCTFQRSLRAASRTHADAGPAGEGRRNGAVRASPARTQARAAAAAQGGRAGGARACWSEPVSSRTSRTAPCIAAGRKLLQPRAGSVGPGPGAAAGGQISDSNAGASTAARGCAAAADAPAAVLPWGISGAADAAPALSCWLARSVAGAAAGPCPAASVAGAAALPPAARALGTAAAAPAAVPPGSSGGSGLGGAAGAAGRLAGAGAAAAAAPSPAAARAAAADALPVESALCPGPARAGCAASTGAARPAAAPLLAAAPGGAGAPRCAPCTGAPGGKPRLVTGAAPAAWGGRGPLLAADRPPHREPAQRARARAARPQLARRCAQGRPAALLLQAAQAGRACQHRAVRSGWHLAGLARCQSPAVPHWRARRARRRPFRGWRGAPAGAPLPSSALGRAAARSGRRSAPRRHAEVARPPWVSALSSSPPGPPEEGPCLCTSTPVSDRQHTAPQRLVVTACCRRPPQWGCSTVAWSGTVPEVRPASGAGA